MNLNELKSNGGIISYSAGSSSLDPLSFRITEEGSAKIGAAVLLFPQLVKYLQKTPVVINCYPATLGSFNSVIYLDTYLRPINFSRGLMLANELDTACIILGQPLTVMDLLFKHCCAEPSLPTPDKVLFALGGYFAPTSFEQSISQLLNPLNVEHDLLHAYGMAEIDFGCLLGINRENESKVRFKIANPEVQVKLDDGKLLLGRAVDGSFFNTGDRASWDNELLTITPGEHRISQEIMASLEQWKFQDWKKRTGHVGRKNSRLVYQLRENEDSNNDAEIDFFDFSRIFKMSWAAKPGWSI